jgi:hypothetical protein
MRQKLLSSPLRNPQLISSAVALPCISVPFATPIVARLSSLSLIFHSGKLALAKNRSVTAKLING